MWTQSSDQIFFANSQSTHISGSTLVSISHSYCEFFTNNCLQVANNFANIAVLHFANTPVPQKPNSSLLFTGRKKELDKLKKIFVDHTNNRLRCCLLWGMGGIGKTQICLKFVEEMSNR